MENSEELGVFSHILLRIYYFSIIERLCFWYFYVHLEKRTSSKIPRSKIRIFHLRWELVYPYTWNCLFITFLYYPHIYKNQENSILLHFSFLMSNSSLYLSYASYYFFEKSYSPRYSRQLTCLVSKYDRGFWVFSSVSKMRVDTRIFSWDRYRYRTSDHPR